jgi:hypothetical protein
MLINMGLQEEIPGPRTEWRKHALGKELDLKTLVWTSGPNLPLARLESRLMCTRCASRGVVVMFEPPSVPKVAVRSI